MGTLTTHVLDTARGCPAAGMAVWLYRLSGNSHRRIAEATTNADGRSDAPLLDGAAFKPGGYELVFLAGDYLRAAGLVGSDPLFLDQIPIRFGIEEDRHYHVPLLLSPFGYTTYRGS
ncbi:MAG: hydroxyisourate hydrolase [Pseudomonadota bacterium]